MTEDGHYVSVSDAARHYGVSRHTIYRWCKLDRLRFVRPGGENGSLRVFIPFVDVSNKDGGQ
jgi:excisionase family DNA binding protein